MSEQTAGSGLFPHHLLDRFREEAIERTMDERRREFSLELELEEAEE